MEASPMRLGRPPTEIRDLAVFQAHVGLAFASALDRRGLLDRFELAGMLDGPAETDGASVLLRIFVNALRFPANDD
jgi:hypothetical protein